MNHSDHTNRDDTDAEMLLNRATTEISCKRSMTNVESVNWNDRDVSEARTQENFTTFDPKYLLYFVYAGISILLFLFLVVIIQVSTLVSMSFQINNLTQQVKSQEDIITKMNLTKLNNGKIYLDINADAIRFPKPITYKISEVVVSSARAYGQQKVWLYMLVTRLRGLGVIVTRKILSNVIATGNFCQKLVAQCTAAH